MTDIWFNILLFALGVLAGAAVTATIYMAGGGEEDDDE